MQFFCQFVKGINNGNTDALSRLLLNKNDSINGYKECDNFYMNLITPNVNSIAD